MQHLARTTAKRGIALLLLCGTVTFFGCSPKKDAQLYIYSDETFWYVMQEEALAFNKIYGFQVTLFPFRAERTSDKTEDSVEIGTDRRAPAPWRSMPQDQTNSTAPRARINPDLELQLERITEEQFGDIFISDSQKHLEKIREYALSANEYPVCRLTLIMLVPKGNPHHFQSIKEVLDAHRKLGIMDPSFDGLGEASWYVLSKIAPGGESAIPMEFIQLYERQYDLLEALEQGQIDAALVWNATSQVNFLLAKYAEEYNTVHKDLMYEAERKRDLVKLRIILQAMYDDLVEQRSFAEEVPLIAHPDERCVVAVRLVALSSAADHGYCERFADFIRSNQGKAILRRFGFVAE